jgi:hypothetical protein
MHEQAKLIQMGLIKDSKVHALVVHEMEQQILSEGQEERKGINHVAFFP